MWSALLMGLLASRPVWGLNKFGILEVVKAFAEDIVAAGRSEMPVYDADIFTSDVKGEIDVFGQLDGREMATDFIFSTFSSAASTPEVISLIGRPVSYNVSAISVQHDVAALSIIFDLEYPMLSKTWPFQIDGWFRVNDDRDIEAFDLVFRHFPWLMEQVMAELDPRLSAVLGPSAANMTAEQRLSTALLRSVCAIATSSCTGPSSQFTDMATCISTLGDKSLGEWYQLRDDSLLCRAVQAPLIATSPERYCPAIASSSSVCVSQDYTSSVNETTLKGWLAAKFVTPENADYAGHIYAVSGQPLDPLLEVGLAQETIHSWDPTLYASATFGYFLFYYAFAHVTFSLFNRYSGCFADLPYEHQKNVVMYFMTIVLTTAALALQLAPLRRAFGHYAVWEVQTIRTAAIMISSLYIFELVFRFNMRYPLVVHHCLTILAISLSVTLVEYTQSPTYVVSGIIWLLQATTEQPTFIGLLGYRMGWSRPLVAKILKFAAIQTFVIKTAAAAGVFAYWAIYQRYTYRAMDYIWSATTVIIVLGLMSTQVWGSWITYMIGARIETSARSRLHDPESPKDETGSEKRPGVAASRNSSSANSSIELVRRVPLPSYTQGNSGSSTPDSTAGLPPLGRPEEGADEQLLRQATQLARVDDVSRFSVDTNHRARASLDADSERGYRQEP